MFLSELPSQSLFTAHPSNFSTLLLDKVLHYHCYPIQVIFSSKPSKMSQSLQPDQTLPLPKVNCLAPPQASEDTAAAKLHEVTIKYNYYVDLAELCRQQYNVHHQNLHSAHATIHKIARRLPSLSVGQTKIEYATERYNLATQGYPGRLSKDMNKERETWKVVVKQARAIKNKV